MKTKPFPWKCVECREREVYPATIPMYSCELQHDGLDYPIIIFNFDAFQCRKCNNFIVDDDSSDRLTDALRESAGLLRPDEIRDKREALGLSQQGLADALRIPAYRVRYWEDGAQLQPRCMDAFMRAFFDLVELRRYLGGP